MTGEVFVARLADFFRAAVFFLTALLTLGRDAAAREAVFLRAVFDLAPVRATLAGRLDFGAFLVELFDFRVLVAALFANVLSSS